MTQLHSQPAPELTLRLTGVAHGGHMVSREEQGRVVFVRHGLPGELVRVRVTDGAPDAPFWRADVVEVVEASADRREHHPWPDADALRCAREGRSPVGGAEFGHAHLWAQRELKRAVLAEQLGHLAHIEWEATVAPVPGETADGCGWRTRIHLDVSERGTAGMYPHRSNDLLSISDMPLATPAIRALAPWELRVPGAARLDVAAPANGSRPLLHVSLQPQLPQDAVTALQTTLTAWGNEQGVSVTAQAPERHEVRVWAGHPYVAETLERTDTEPLTWRVSPTGFWQIHRAAPATLVRAVLDAAQLAAGESVWDLYSGAGLFTAAAAHAVGSRGTVFAVEGSPVTATDAQHNLAGHPQARVTRGDVARVLTGRPATRGRSRVPRRGGPPPVRAPRPGVVVLDPPRSGAAKEVLAAVDAADPRAIVYVACDPAALARDVGRLGRKGWRVSRIQAFDLYPNTHHVEAVALLRRG